MSDCRISFLGDCALLLRWGEQPDPAINRRVHAFAAGLREHAPDWLVDLTPAFASLAVHVDTTRIGGADPLEAARREIAALLDRASTHGDASADRAFEVPVLYGGDEGPDLAEVAAHSGLPVEEAVARHASGDYVVAMIGFAPGFPYLLGLDPVLAMPRLATPRRRVAAGSVGIGGVQAGIYPDAGPGGWRLIGRTPLRLFDAHRDPPSLLQPGDRVRFVAIDAAAFASLDGHPR
jgi:KipI family sensor histidine kinase inhibitor